MDAIPMMRATIEPIFGDGFERRVRRPVIETDVPPSARFLIYVADRRYAALRRAIDFVVAAILLFVVAPILALAALAIFAEDRGAILFTQRRLGRFERPFVIYKLRTMRPHQCGDEASPSAADDPRITRVGAVLRKTSIDELPQLFNVLRGEMALVGPRPEMPLVVEGYERWQHLRHLATPGITGLWQVTCRPRIRLHRPEATIIDLDYISRTSLLVDLSILAKTLRAVVSRQGAF